jgi:hypothetical protein
MIKMTVLNSPIIKNILHFLRKLKLKKLMDNEIKIYNKVIYTKINY